MKPQDRLAAVQAKYLDAITVIIRDDAPLIHCNDSPSFRSVRIQLTEDQAKAIRLRHADEDYSRCFVEKADKKT